MLLRTLQDLASRLSSYNERLELPDVQPGMEVLVMHRASFWGKSTYRFTGVIVGATEERVIIDNIKLPDPGMIGLGVIESPAQLGLVADEPSVTFLLKASLWNKMTHVYS